jgi:hypothetical protein
MLRSILAVVAGFAVTALLVMISDPIIMLLMPGAIQTMPGGEMVPSAPYYIANLIAGTLSAVVGGFVMAVIARQAIMKHLYWLIGVLVAFGIVSAATGGALVPLWYSVLVIALGIIGYYLGVRLYLARRGQEPAPASMADAP